MKVKLPLKLTLTDRDGIVLDEWDSVDDMDVLSAMVDATCGPAKDAIIEAMDDELGTLLKEVNR